MDEEIINMYEAYYKCLRDVVGSYDWEPNYIDGVLNDITKLENKVKDKNFYLGVVGAFSSGKSTMINSLLGINLLPTDAIQGTTVSATVIKKTDSNDIEIIYSNGTKKRFSQNRDELLNRYSLNIVFDDSEDATLEVEKVALWDRFVKWLFDLFGKSANEADIDDCKRMYTEEMLYLFKKLISDEQAATDIEYVCLEMNNQVLNYDIALVDTPGTESVNARHNTVTKNVIDNICDAIIVIIPYDEPVSQSLVQYIESHLKDQIDKCIFVVTKVELLNDYDELPRLMKVVKKRLENSLVISEPIVLAMPTLMHLEEVDIKMTKTGLLDDISSENKTMLLELFDESVNKVWNTLQEKRKDFVKKKLVNMSQKLCEKLNESLDVEVDTNFKAQEEIKKKTPEKLSDFIEKEKGKIDKKCESIKIRLSSKSTTIRSIFNTIIEDIEFIISDCCNSKNIISNLSQCDDAYSKIQEQCKQSFVGILNELKQNYNETLIDIGKNFEQTYSDCNVKRIDLKVIHDFTWDSYYSYCSKSIENYKTLTNNLNSTLSSEITGIQNKIKAIFLKPTDRHKDLCKYKIKEFISEEQKKIIDKISVLMQQYSDTLKEEAMNLLQEYVNQYGTSISKYISNNENGIMNFLNRELKARQDIEKIHEFVNKIMKS